MTSLTRTPLAAIHFNDDSGKHIRVYYQAPNGDIKESFYDDSLSGWHPRPENTVGHGKLNTGIAALVWGKGTQIGVYFLGDDGSIVERLYSAGTSGWTNGGMTGRYHAAPYSRLGALSIRNGQDIHIYYQDTNNKLREFIYRVPQGYLEGTDKLPVALAGTAIAAVANPNENGQFWVYFQATDLKLQEYWCNNNSWNQFALHNSNQVYPPQAAIAAVAWSNPAKTRLLSVDQNNKICTTAYDATGTWSPTQELAESTITLTDLALISAAGGSQSAAAQPALRLYYQNFGARISELSSQDGDNWSVSQSNIA
ncbi:fucose-specific lectin [Pluteus cervinus]|uniref:Fucose-specific lectin n=1 Tax=Pluteus cervinus TaxID=181527 RepID=A0ACD3ALV1_9AGAR|nr:fucose-specific lectin [Pluteus cervinus]